MESIKKNQIKRKILRSRDKKTLTIEDYKNQNIMLNLSKTIQTNIKGENMTMENKDWDSFQSKEKFVKLIAGKPKALVINDYNAGTTEIKSKKDGVEVVENIPAILCVVSKEDGEVLKENKTYTITSKNLATMIRPILEKKLPASVTIIQYGTGFDTTYDVKEN